MVRSHSMSCGTYPRRCTAGVLAAYGVVVAVFQDDVLGGALGIAPSIEWAPMQPGDVQQTAADLTKSSRVLGYLPRMPFPEGVRKFVSWYREAYGRAD